MEACLSNMKVLDFSFFLQSYMNLRLTCTHSMIKLLLTIIFSHFRNLTILLGQYQAQRGHLLPLWVAQRFHPRLE